MVESEDKCGAASLAEELLISFLNSRIISVKSLRRSISFAEIGIQQVREGVQSCFQSLIFGAVWC